MLNCQSRKYLCFWPNFWFKENCYRFIKLTSYPTVLGNLPFLLLQKISAEKLLFLKKKKIKKTSFQNFTEYVQDAKFLVDILSVNKSLIDSIEVTRKLACLNLCRRSTSCFMASFNDLNDCKMYAAPYANLTLSNSSSFYIKKSYYKYFILIY